MVKRHVDLEVRCNSCSVENNFDCIADEDGVVLSPWIHGSSSDFGFVLMSSIQQFGNKCGRTSLHKGAVVGGNLLRSLVRILPYFIRLRH